jgi:hypothetical protein
MAYFKYLPLAALAVMTIASPALAQSGSPARASSDVFGNTQLDELNYEQGFRKDPASAAEAYRMASRFATCVTRFDSKRSAAVLAADAGSGAEAAALTALARKYGSCVGATGGVPSLLLRGALAEALWTKGGSIPNPSKRTKVDMTEIESFFKTSPRSEMLSKVGTLPLGWVSRCQVMAMPSLSAAVLKAVPGSPEERAAAAALYSKSSVCGVQSLGDTIVTYSRATIADALYQDTIRSTKG